jgi:hypothetical protein
VAGFLNDVTDAAGRGSNPALPPEYLGNRHNQQTGTMKGNSGEWMRTRAKRSLYVEAAERAADLWTVASAAAITVGAAALLAAFLGVMIGVMVVAAQLVIGAF